MQKWKPIPHQTKSREFIPIIFPIYAVFWRQHSIKWRWIRSTYSIHQNLGKSIVTITNEDKQPKGFAIYSTKDKQAHVETLIYFDSQAIQDLLSYISINNEVTSILISESERFDKLFPFHFPRMDKKLMVRLNNYKLFDKFSNTNVRNAKAAYELLEKPTWNHFQ